MNLTQITDLLIADLQSLHFSPPVVYVYNPLIYARRSHQQYIEQYGQSPKEILLLGMNPGPWGMAQSGVPFGDVPSVRDWLGIQEIVEKPHPEHPKRPVLGFDCPRREVSGMRLWGWISKTFQTPEQFFSRFYVANYCPLGFLEVSGRNRTPDKLPKSEREKLLAICDLALRRTVEYFQCKHVIGIGLFAAERARQALAGMDVTITSIPHPSPANPSANRGWEALVNERFQQWEIKI
jgi:single-strand selective monofunctional uracil DNA glycosylase